MSSAPPDTSLGLASRIRSARAAAVLSQAELAALLGVSVRAVQGWEAGTVPQPRRRRAVLAFIAEHEQIAAA